MGSQISKEETEVASNDADRRSALDFGKLGCGWIIEWLSDPSRAIYYRVPDANWAGGCEMQVEALGFAAKVILHPSPDGIIRSWSADFDLPASGDATATIIDGIEMAVRDRLGPPSKSAWQIGDDGLDVILDWEEQATSLEILNFEGGGDPASVRLWRTSVAGEESSSRSGLNGL